MSSLLISYQRICRRKTRGGGFIGSPAPLFHCLRISGMLFTILSLDGIVPQAIFESLKGQTEHGTSPARLTEVTEAFFLVYVHACFHI